MDDTRVRFLAAIVGRLGIDQVVELHLFSPIRQGVLETGVAVVAVVPGDVPAEPLVVPGDLPAEPFVVPGDLPAEPPVVPGDLAAAPALEEEPSPYADESPTQPELPPVTMAAPPTPDNVGEPRHVVYTARYRLTRKGPDRGKWQFEIAATADAPLATVEQVARGVTLRSRDLTESERLSGEQLRALMGEPAWRSLT